MKVKVYNAEKQLGLEEKIASQGSVAFIAKVINDTDTYTKIKQTQSIKDLIAHAGTNDQDVHLVYSILVSTVWNKNDDVFLKEPVWLARNTAKFKPTNLDHDEKQILGTIVDCWPVDQDLNLIPDDTSIEDLPDTYHLLVSSVIYKAWQDPELRARSENLIKEIEAGTKFVSMECIFSGFDYGLISPDGENVVISRDEATAFLSQHLRAYGGTGSYQGYKIGRILKNICFSGKGFVDKPANPDSIIFDKNHIFNFAKTIDITKSMFLLKNGVNDITKLKSSEENFIMTEKLDKQISDLTEAVVGLKADADSKITNYENQIKTLNETIATLQSKVETLEKELSASSEAAVELKKTLDEKAASLQTVQAEMDNMKKEQKKKQRKDEMMTKCGFTSEEAEAQYENFSALSDDQFKAIIDVLAVKFAMSKKTETTTENTETTASEIVDTTTTETAITVPSTETNQSEEARAGIQKWVESIVTKPKKTRNKGE